MFTIDLELLERYIPVMTDTNLILKLTIAIQALRDITSPLLKLQRDAEAENARLNGYAAQLCSDPSFLRSIARDALDKIQKLEPIVVENVPSHIQRLYAEVMALYEASTPEEKERMWKEQRRNWAISNLRWENPHLSLEEATERILEAEVRMEAK